MSKVQVIYIPGLGDLRPWGQDKILKLWQLFDCQVHYSPVGWAVDEPYQDKLDRLLKLVDKLSVTGHKIAVIGTSAGASMAMNLYAERKSKIQAVVFVSGKLLYPETIDEHYFIENPAFKESAFNGAASIEKLDKEDKAKMLTVTPFEDQTVPVKAARVPGVKDKRSPILFHIPGIFIALTFNSFGICRFIKSRIAND